MHPECLKYLRQFGSMDSLSVIEIGSRDINGSARAFWPNARWVGLDLHPGPAVDIVCDAETYRPEAPVDMVICCEVLEHAANWRELIAVAATWLKPGGRFIVTCAGPGRAEHSAIDGGSLRSDEHYASISQDQLAEELYYAGFHHIDVGGEDVAKDTRATGLKA